jgi:hypothetical protein
LKKNAKIDTMNEASENSNESEKLARANGQPEFSRSNTGSDDHLSIGYEEVISPDGNQRINQAFDLLFQEVIRIRTSRNPHEISSHIRQGFNSPTGGGTNC